MDANTSGVPRRTAVVGAVAIAGAAAGCARYGDTTEPAQTGTSAPAEGVVLGKAADVPVGGGTVFRDQQIVVTQPTAGEFKGFSAVCTHQGCIVAKVTNGTIDCECHGSAFRLDDGAVTAGPAERPLPAEPVTVTADGELVTGTAPEPETTEPETTEPPTDVAEPTPPAGLASTGEIPVGGGKIFADEQVVITQPEPGEFKGFSAVCTHQGCLVAEIAGSTINCPCHGSTFQLADGAVANGPAREPLPARALTITGDQISLA